MNYIKSYKVFEGGLYTAKQHEYSIYEWFEDLKRVQWGNKGNSNTANLKLWTNHFIGDGYWEKINSLVDKMFQALKKVDTDEINDRMYDVYDAVVPSDKEKYTMCCIAYGDYDHINDPKDRKYNGLLSVRDPQNPNKIYIIVHILIQILHPTLFIGYPSFPIRQTDSQDYVTDKKWQCKNFDIKEYGIYDGFEYTQNGKTNQIWSSHLKKIELYSVDTVLEMYKPCVTINIGGYSNSHITGKMNLLKLEKEIDETLESILPTLDYEEVIFDASRGDRRWDNIENYEVYDYTLKILLKM